MNTPTFDVDFARSQFPKGVWDWSFFENAGGSFVPTSVIDRLTSYMTETQVQPGARYPASALAADRMADGHRLMAEMIGAAPDEVTVSASTSINVYVLSHALRPLWQDGDEVIVAVQNHEANSGSWRRLADTGITIIEWPVDPLSGAMDPATLAGLLTDKTRLVAFPHVSNVLGAINDVPAITRMVHDAGAMVCVDGVAYAPHRAVDVKAWDVDFYLFSFYKVFGPHMGCLYGKKERLLEARGQYHYFIGEDETAKKLNPSGPQHEMIASLCGIADYFEALASHHLPEKPNSLHDRVKAVCDLAARHEEGLARRFIDFAATKPALRLIGPQSGEHDVRVPTFSFVVEGRRSSDICNALLADKVGLSNGHFYARRLIEAVGISDSEDGVIRASMAHYTSADDVERLIAGLDRIL